MAQRWVGAVAAAALMGAMIAGAAGTVSAATRGPVHSETRIDYHDPVGRETRSVRPIHPRSGESLTQTVRLQIR